MTTYTFNQTINPYKLLPSPNLTPLPPSTDVFRLTFASPATAATCFQSCFINNEHIMRRPTTIAMGGKVLSLGKMEEKGSLRGSQKTRCFRQFLARPGPNVSTSLSTV